MNQILRNDTNSSLANCHERIAASKKVKAFFSPPFFFILSCEHRKKIIVTSKHGERRPCEPRSCSGGGFRFNLYPFRPFRVFPFSRHRSYLTATLLYYCSPRGHARWTTWDQWVRVFIRGTRPPLVYSLRSDASIFICFICLANFEAKKKYANLLLFLAFLEIFLRGSFVKLYSC